MIQTSALLKFSEVFGPPLFKILHTLLGTSNRFRVEVRIAFNLGVIYE